MGEVPDLNGLTQLAGADFTGNQFSGSIPEFGDLPQLTYLNLTSNQLSGTLPESIALLPSLTSLSLNYNQIAGVMTDAFASSPILGIGFDTAAISVGETATFTISGGTSPYNAASSDELTATASVSDDTLTVTGVTEGSASITITDAGSGFALLDVDVTGTSSGSGQNIRLALYDVSWHVEALSDAGDLSSTIGTSNQWNCKFQPSQSVGLISPADGSTLDQSTDSAPLFTWNTYQGSDVYELILARVGSIGFDQVINYPNEVFNILTMDEVK